MYEFPGSVCKGFLVAAAIALGSTGARADIIVVTGVNNQGTDNVLLNPATNVGNVTGTVGPDNLLVNFTSTSGSDLLSANPSGQATVSGGTGNSPFSQLAFELANNTTFTRAVFNINAATSGDVQLHVEGINIDGGFFEQNFSLDANGQNFFTVTGINGQLIDSISLTALNGAIFDDVRQVRLGGFQAVPGPIVGAGLPGLLLALGGLWACGRRRRAAA